MRISSYPIGALAPGRLAIIGRPRGGDWLDDELIELRASGTDVLVSLLCPDEAAELDLVREPEAARAAGLEFASFPIPDRGVPDLAAIRPVLAQLHASLRAGRSIAVHCRMGIGRSSLVAASLLVLDGHSADDAWREIERARGRPVPDTPEQKAWVAQLARDAADT